MNSPDRLIELITTVVIEARETASTGVVELNAIRTLCVQTAKIHHPDLVTFLSSVGGLVAVSVTLSQLPLLVAANNARGTSWAYVQGTNLVN